MIKFKCVRCNAVVKAPDAAVGKNVKCPACQMKLSVPRPKARKPAPPLKPILYVTLGVIAFGLAAWAVWPASRAPVVTEEKRKATERERERAQRMKSSEREKRERERMTEDDVTRRKDVENYQRREAEMRRKADEERMKAEKRDQERFEYEEKMRQKLMEIDRRKDKNRVVEPTP